MTDYNATRAEAMASHAKRATMYGGQSQAYASGGGVHSDERQDRALIKTMLAKEEKKEARADGGSVEGRARGGRADRPRHGSKTVVNVVAPQMPPQAARPVPVPVPMKPPMAGGPPGAMPPGAGMGPPPGGPPPGMPMRAGGGKITGGALSGVGRLEKAAGGIKGPMIARE